MDKSIFIKDLKINFESTKVLKGINLEVDKGTIIGYIGPNGAGKSTTVKIILGLVEGYTGVVKIFGQDISNGNDEYKKRIGYVPEVAETYESLTAREYLTFIGQLYGLEYHIVDKKAYELMDILGIKEIMIGLKNEGKTIFYSSHIM